MSITEVLHEQDGDYYWVKTSHTQDWHVVTGTELSSQGIGKGPLIGLEQEILRFYNSGKEEALTSRARACDCGSWVTYGRSTADVARIHSHWCSTNAN